MPSQYHRENPLIVNKEISDAKLLDQQIKISEKFSKALDESQKAIEKKDFQKVDRKIKTMEVLNISRKLATEEQNKRSKRSMKVHKIRKSLEKEKAK